ncbi:TPA: ProQ/FinO family protein [Enterobacter hormaechei subsp. steigerwaltii]|nr:ProQ/FinO family protein [Enterobacter hormaechei subsp. steigerwaltii]
MTKLSIGRKPTGEFNAPRKAVVVTKQKTATSALPGLKKRASAPPVAPEVETNVAPPVVSTKKPATDTVIKNLEELKHGLARAKRSANQKFTPLNKRPDLLAVLANWPEAFTPDAPRPIAIGIFEMALEDIKARGLSVPRHKLTSALTAYCASPAYRSALLTETHRIGLDGQPCGEVSDSAREMARKPPQPVLKREKAKAKLANIEKQIADLLALYDFPSS